MAYTALLLTIITLMGGFISVITYRYIDSQRDFNRDILKSNEQKTEAINSIKIDMHNVSQKVDGLKSDIERTHESIITNFASEIKPLEKRVEKLENHVYSRKQNVA